MAAVASPSKERGASPAPSAADAAPSAADAAPNGTLSP